MRGVRRAGVGGLVMGLALLTAVLVGLMVGAADIPVVDVWRALTGEGGDSSATAIVRSLRLPRVIAAGLVGGALTISGVLFQALLRNPLAEPYLLGVSSGAAFGAVLGLTVLGGALGAFGTVGLAFAGGLLAIAIVFRVALAVGRVDTYVLILAGVVVSAFFGAGVMLLLALAEGEAMRSAVLWTMGSFERVTWTSAGVMAACLVVAGIAALGLARHLDAMMLGEDAASYLGVQTERLKRVTYALASLLAAVSVSLAGVIGFVGLIVPHATRMIWGPAHRRLLPLAALMGAAVMILADAVARTAFRPLELPVGVVTALLGVPLFLLLLRRRHV